MATAWVESCTNTGIDGCQHGQNCVCMDIGLDGNIDGCRHEWMEYVWGWCIYVCNMIGWMETQMDAGKNGWNMSRDGVCMHIICINGWNMDNELCQQ